MQETRSPGALVILLARFGFFLMEIGLAKSFGVLVPDLEEQLQTSNAVIGLVTSLSLSAMYLGSPLSKIVLHHCSHRRLLTSVSGLVAGVALIGTAFTKNAVVMSLLFFTMGLCCSVINLQAIVLLFDYYEKDYSFASCVSIIGIPLGGAILPPVTEKLLEAYGVSGSLLIIGAVTLNMFPIGLAMKERFPAKRKRGPTNTNTSEDRNPNMRSNQETRNRNGDSSNGMLSAENTVVIGVGKEHDLKKRSSVMQLISSHEDSPRQTPVIETTPSEKDQRCKIPVECQEETPRGNGVEPSTSLTLGKEHNNATFFRSHKNRDAKSDPSDGIDMSRNFSDEILSLDDMVIGVGMGHGQKRTSVAQLIPSNKDVEEMAVEDQPRGNFDDLEPSLSFSPDEMMVHYVKDDSVGHVGSDEKSKSANEEIRRNDLSDDVQKPSRRQHPVKTCLVRCHLWVLVKEPLFSVVYLPSLMLLFTVTGGWALFVVLYAVEHGIDLSRAAYLPTCGAIGGIVSSILMSAAMWYRPKWSPHLYLLNLIISASCFFLQTLNSSYIYLLFMSFFIGFGLFGANVISEAVMALSVAPENFNDAGSTFLFSVGFGYLLSGYLAGFVRDVTDDIQITFLFLGAMTVVSSLLLVILMICLRRRAHSQIRDRSASTTTEPSHHHDLDDQLPSHPQSHNGDGQTNRGYEQYI